MAYRRSLDFLPSVFRTEVNDKFLSSTLDQLISEPELKRLGGYIGQRFSPVAGPTDSYIIEPTDLRQNYQLEATTAYIDADDKARFVSGYSDLLRKIDALGGYTNDHSRLFSSTIYNYDGFIDYDKFLNYSYYYWLPNGPDPVTVFATAIPLQQTYSVIQPSAFQFTNGQYDFESFDSKAFDVSENAIIKVRQDGIKFDVTGSDINPTIRLARGGTYTFKLDQLGHGFYIQTRPGTNTSYDWQRNLDVRDVYGVVNNGADIGELVFNVPNADEQDFFLRMTKADSAYLVAHSSKKNRALRFNEVHHTLYTDLITEHGGIDGQRMLEGKTIVFLADSATGQNPQPWQAYTDYKEGELLIYGNTVYRVLTDFTTGRVFNDNYLELYDLQNSWYVPALYDSSEQPFDSNGFDRGSDVDFDDRFSKFTVRINDEGYVKLTPTIAIAKNNKIEILEGITYGNREIYRDTSDLMTLVPPITANLTRLYYADALDPNVGGVIEIVEQDNNLKIDVENSILGLKSYQSPNKVKLTNGLKIRFLEDVVPASYANKEYYVEGVGESIHLIDTDSLAIAETWLDTIESTFDTSLFDQVAFSASTNSPTTPDYFVIKRSSLDRNAWTRQNRWFHKDVIELTAQYNNYPPIIESDQRARRPIIEFDPNLQLFNMGQIAKTPVDVIDFKSYDALSNIEGSPITLGEENIVKFTGSPAIVAEYRAARESEGYSLIREKVISEDVVTIEMKLGGVSSYYADGIPLYPGMRVIFARDVDPDVRNKIYVVEWIKPQSNTENRAWTFEIDNAISAYDLNFDVGDTSRLLVQINGIEASKQGYLWSYNASSQSIVFETIPPTGSTLTVSLTFKNQIHLVPADDAEVQEGDCVFIKQGLEHQGHAFYLDNNEWKFAQQKTSINQAPLFDLFDQERKSLSDATKYPSTTFVGNRLFGYAPGSSVKDPILGIKLKYRNINNIGDIVFSDFVSTGSFLYKDGQQSINKPTVGAKVKQNNSDRTHTFRNQWQKVRDKSRQYQLQTYYATEYQKNLFRLNVIPAGVGEEQLSNIIVYVNNNLLYTNRYDIQKESGIGYLSLNEDLAVGDKVDIKIYSTDNTQNAIFSIPHNYSNNPFNKEVTEITLGQMRNHIISAIEDISDLSDTALTTDNLRDTKDVKSYPGKILQNSGNPHIANFFLNDERANFFDSVTYTQREYTRFKNRFLELAKDLAVAGEKPSLTVDRVLIEMASNKNKNFAFFTSDMIPFGNDYNLRTYKVIDTRLDTYDLSAIVDLSKPNSKAVLVYLNGTQLVVNSDYYFSTTRPILELDLTKVTLNVDDVIEVREYSSTDGSFVPPTPTKLGLYPLSVPTIVQDSYGENTRNMVRGHDGSLIAMFGDSRDQVLIEFENRIYNNIKANYNPARFDVWNYVPGAFRQTDYSYQEFTSILSSHFAAWSGMNGVVVSDFRQFDANDPFTYNYGRFTNKVDGNLMPASNWRGIYKYFYDTDAPHLRPWEMLGFVAEPTWWQNTYGSAPYTSGNQVLWNDLEVGVIANGERKGIDSRFARPGLSKIIPVSESGELLSPLACVVKDINNLDVSGFYKFGDIGPAELAWRQSSEYPFVVQLAIALMKPAEYFSINVDTTRQVVELDDQQLIFSDTGIRDTSTELIQNEIDSTGLVHRSNSYLTWISEYCRSRGIDVTECIGDRFRNLQARLGYKVAGYTDKNYLRIITEQYTPASNNPTVVIPDDDFDIVLNKSSPINNLTYSGVIITKTVDGYSVTGYDDNKPYFMIEGSTENSNRTYIKVGKLAITKYHDGNGTFYRVPYGTEFFDIEQVADFLISYGRYLKGQGFDFSDKLDSDANWSKDWDLSIREFLFYVQQGWGVDVALSLSPVGSKINYRSSFGSVDGLTNRPLSTRALDENFNIIRSSEYTVSRNGRDFSLTVDDERGIYLLDINVVEHEHVILFQNKTRFNDIIYDPVLGDRQYKLKVEGFKTGDWDGTYGAAGFVINDDNVSEWQPGTNYSKGDIVIYKGAYFTAAEKTAATAEFNTVDWITTEYDSIKKGLLPNLANRSAMFKKFYDTNDVNLEEAGQLLGKEMIGFEPRSYMTDLSISDTSQFKFYQGMISQKGTMSSFDKLLKAKLDNFGGNASVYEEWAIRVGAYGATDSTLNMQIELDETWADKDPLVVELLNDNDPKPTTHKGLNAKELYIKHVPYDKNFLRNRTLKSYSTDLYSAGYAQPDDVDFLSPTVADINSYISAAEVQKGNLIWIAADRNNQWNVYRVNETELKLKSANITSNGDATVKCHNNHELEEFDVIFIKQDANAALLVLNGFYVVNRVIDAQTFVISTGFGSLQIPKLTGLTFKLSPMRFDTVKDVAGNEPLMGWSKNDTIFLDQANDNGWAAYENSSPWSVGPNFSCNSTEAGDKLGKSIATDIENYYMIAGRPGHNGSQGGIILYSVTSSGQLEEIASLTTNTTNVSDVGFSVTASNDATFAAGAPTSDDIGFAITVAKNPESDDFRLQQIIAPNTLDNLGEFGYSIKLSNDGNWLAIGQPAADEGYVYIYQRKFVNTGQATTVLFEGDGSTNIFELTLDAANPNSAESVIVVQDGFTLEPLTDYTIATSSLVLSATPDVGSELVVTVNRGNPEQTFVADGSSVYYGLTGDNATPSSIYSLFVEVDGVIQAPFRDYTLEYIGGQYFILFSTTPPGGVEIDVAQRTHYEYVTAFTSDSALVGDRFGHSLDWSDLGKQLIIGAPNTTIIGEDGSSATAGSGAVYVYDRSFESFYATGTQLSFTTEGTIIGTPFVYVDDDRKVESVDYTRAGDTITFTDAPTIGSIVKISTNEFYQTDFMSSYDANETLETDTNFGYSVDICPTNCSVYIGSPGSDGTKINAGKVFRFVNQGRLFGKITGTAIDPVIDVSGSISINDFTIALDSGFTLDDVIAAINDAAIPGVTASNVDDQLHIESDSTITGEKLLINPLSGSAIEDLGLTLYAYQQTINSPANADYAEFGKSLRVSPTADLLAIGSSNAPTRLTTTIDNGETYFDGKATLIRDVVKQSGAVWLYQYLSVPNTSVDNPGYFIPAQSLVNNKIDRYDEYGSDIAMNHTAIYVGAPGDDTNADNAGLVFSFANASQEKVWSTKRSEERKVDIDLINRVFLYNKTSNQIVADLDYVDPFKGKIIGLAAEEISYQTPFDPAVYVGTYAGTLWGRDQVGKVWWDISQTRWLNYEQSDAATRGANWNAAFPGSKILCFEWVESDVPPSQYADTKDTTSFARSSRYNTESTIDAVTGIVTNKYYYWVAGKQTIPDVPNRNYSITAIEGFIANPRSAGIPFIAFLSPNAFALYNVSDLLQNNDVVLNIDYDVVYNENSIHSEFQLIAENDANSIPNRQLVKKIIDSLAGIDDRGNKVPDIKLTVGEAYGIDFRPRQTMFRDRTYALRSIVSYLNLILAKTPIIYTKDLAAFINYEKIPLADSGAYDDSVNDEVELGYLNIELYPENYKVLVRSDSAVADRWAIYKKTNGQWNLVKVQAFDTRRYLEQIDWVKPGVDDPKVTNYTLNYSYELVTITPEINETVKVKDYNNGRYAVLQYTSSGWDIIKQELATYRIKDELWDASILAQGYSTETFDVQLFDDDPSIEIQLLLNACYNDIFTEEEAIEKNRWFLLTIKHVLAEQKYVDYAFKTSFIKVEHRNNQAISQIPSLQKDRQDSLRQYIEEVKPYHTKIREFVNAHDSRDNLGAATTDFDVPAYYDEVTGKYTSVTGRDEIDDIILERPEYQAFVNNYGFNIDEVLIADTGLGYTANPTLNVTGRDGKGSGVVLDTTIVNGALTKVTVVNKGSGFVSLPAIASDQTNSITIESDGVTTEYRVLPFVPNNPELIPVRNISINKKLIYNLDYYIDGTTVFFNNPLEENNQVRIEFDARLVPVMKNDRIRTIKDTIKFDRLPNNGGFMVQFLDDAGDPVDIRTQRKSRLLGDQGVLDELFDALSNFEWIKQDVESIQWPVPGVSEYRIFPDNSGRIQVQYKKTPGGWTAASLQAHLRELGSSVGVDELDISGTTVVVDGNMSLYQPSVFAWEANTRYDTGDIITYNNLAYTLKDSVPSFTSADSFDTENLRLYDASEFEGHINRTWAYYQPAAGLPGRDLGQLFKGIEYPGVKVQGPSFRDEPGYDVGNYDMAAFDQYIIGPEGVAILDPKILDQTLYSNFLDTTLGTKPADIITAGSGFVDPYSSHAPEETVPGRVYDTLDIKVYTIPLSDVTGRDDLGMIINLSAYRVNGSTEFAFSPTATGGDDIVIFTSEQGRLDVDADYTVDHINHTVTVSKPLLPDDNIYIYIINGGGDGLIYDAGFVGNGETKTFILQADSTKVNQSFVTINGVRQTDYEIEYFQPGVAQVVFGNTISTPTATDYIHVSLFKTDSDTQQFVESTTELHTINGVIYPTDYTITLSNPLGYSLPIADKIIVDLNNSRLRPPAVKYYAGDDATVNFAVPYISDVDRTSITDSSVKVSLNGTELLPSIGYSLSADDGSSWPHVIMNAAPAEGDLLTVALQTKSDYHIIDSTTLRLSADLDLAVNDKIRVTAFTNHEKLGIRTSVFKGTIADSVSADIGFDDVGFDAIGLDAGTTLVVSTKDYDLSTPVQNINHLLVSVDVDNSAGGQYLMPNEDYILIDNGAKIRLGPSVTVLAESVIVITQFSEHVQQPAIGFRIFKDLNDNFDYLRLASDAITKLTQPLLLTDEEIFVEDASVLPDPNIAQSIPGVIMVGGERVTYFGIDRTNNKLFNIRRGTAGTGAISVIPENTLVQDASAKQKIPDAHASIWYDQGDGTATNGLGLQNSNTMQAQFLLEKPTLLQSQVFDVAYFLKGYATPGYVEGNLY